MPTLHYIFDRTRSRLTPGVQSLEDVERNIDLLGSQSVVRTHNEPVNQLNGFSAAWSLDWSVGR